MNCVAEHVAQRWRYALDMLYICGQIAPVAFQRRSKVLCQICLILAQRTTVIPHPLLKLIPCSTPS